MPNHTAIFEGKSAPIVQLEELAGMACACCPDGSGPLVLNPACHPGAGLEVIALERQSPAPVLFVRCARCKKSVAAFHVTDQGAA